MRCLRLVVVLAVLLAAPATLGAALEGQATWAAHVSLVPTWFDPGETTTGTQFMVTFALHDALLKPMPGNPMAPSLAEAWPAPKYAYDPARARQLLAEAGYPNGFEGGDFFSDNVTVSVVEAIVNDWRGVGIRTKLRPMERAGFFGQFREKKLRGVLHAFIGVHGNAATRLDAFVAAGGVYAYGSYPDIEALLKDQGNELDRKKREAILYKIQQLVHEKAMFAPIWELAFMNGHGPRLAESGLGLIPDYFYSAPYEDIRLKGK
jgi:peptide/nickel transport system substrate-binding protein